MPFVHKHHQIGLAQNRVVTITYPNEGDYIIAGQFFNPTWTVNQGSDYAAIYRSDGVLLGVNTSGGVELTMPSGGLSFYVHCWGIKSQTVSINETIVPTMVTLTAPTTGLYPPGGELLAYWTVDQGSDYGDVYVNDILVGSGTSGTVYFNLPSGGGTIYVICSGVQSNTETLGECTMGCTDSGAMNYDPSATCDDGSCTYCVYGCTDPSADNYNGSATCDDGSCLYTPSGFFTQPYADQTFTDADTINIDVTWTNGNYGDASAVLKVYGAGGNLVDPVASGGWITGLSGNTISGGVESTYTLELVITYNGGIQSVSIYSNSFVITP